MGRGRKEEKRYGERGRRGKWDVDTGGMKGGKSRDERGGEEVRVGERRREKEGGVGRWREGDRGGGETAGEERRMRIVFWNVTGLKNKDKGFWSGLKDWEVVVLIETWIERKEWRRIKRGCQGGMSGNCKKPRGRIRKGGQ